MLFLKCQVILNFPLQATPSRCTLLPLERKCTLAAVLDNGLAVCIKSLLKVHTLCHGYSTSWK